MIGVKTLQAAFQLLAGALRVAMHRLFRKEHLAAIGPQRFPKFRFRFTIEVRRGAVKIIHASVVRRRDAARGFLLRKSANHDATERDDREVNSILVTTARQRCLPTIGGRGSQGRCSAKKPATIHKLVPPPAHCTAWCLAAQQWLPFSAPAAWELCTNGGL